MVFVIIELKEFITGNNVASWMVISVMLAITFACTCKRNSTFSVAFYTAAAGVITLLTYGLALPVFVFGWMGATKK